MDKLKIWYDPEGDFLEISFSQKPGEYRPTPSKSVMMKVDASGGIIGFAVLNISQVESAPLEIELPMEELKNLPVLRALAPFLSKNRI